MSAPKRRALTLILGLAVVFALLLPSLRPRMAPRYTITDLGVLPGDTVSSASGINNHGDIIGFSENDNNDERVFLYAHGRMTVVKSAKSFNGNPTINDSGHINQRQRISSAASTSGYERSLPHHAVLYSGSKKIDFTVPPGWMRTNLLGVNEQGQVIGICWRQTLGSRPSWGPFVYDSKTRKFSMLPLPPGCLNAEVNGINDHGQMTGYTWRQGGYSGQAVLWNAGQPALLQTVPGRDSSEGLGINTQGEVVGSAGSEPNAAGQFVNSHNIRLSLLVPLFRRQWEDHAVIFQQGKAEDLNALIPEDADWTLTEANSINDRGQIVGEGVHHGQQRAFLLTPR